MLTNDGLLLLDPVTGKVRLNYEWKFQGYRALQPTVIGEDVILLPTPMTEGTRAIRVSKKGEPLAAEELWTSKQLKTDFSELIAHQGYSTASMAPCSVASISRPEHARGRTGAMADRRCC
jgi:hypothetical protein